MKTILLIILAASLTGCFVAVGVNYTDEKGRTYGATTSVSKLPKPSGK